MSNTPPPTGLPTTTILELAQKDAHVVKKNGDYFCEFTEPVTLKAGDQLNVKMVAIDSQDADSESIVLPLNSIPDPNPQNKGSTTVTLGFSYYDMNYDLTTGYTADPVNRKQFVLGETGAGNVYAPDCQPYQPYGNVSSQELDQVTMTFTKTYTNGHTGDQARLDGFKVNVGFTYYEPQANGTSILRQTNLTTGEYMFSNQTSYTNLNKNARPTSIKTGTVATCTLYGGTGSKKIIYKKGTLQVASVSLVVDMTDQSVLPVTVSNGFDFMNYSGNTSSSTEAVVDVNNNGMVINTGSTAVSITCTTNHNSAIGDVIQLSGVVGANGALNGIPLTQLNDSQVVTAIGSVTELTFEVATTATSNGAGTGGAAMKIERAGRVQLITGTQSIQIPHGRYDRESMAAFITKAFSIVTIGSQQDPFAGGTTFQPDTNLQFRTNDSTFGSIRFRKMEQYAATNDEILFDNTNSYVYDRAGGGPTGTAPVDMLIGAAKFSMTYGINGNIYQWDNGHCAVCNPANLFPAGTVAPTPSTTVGFYQIGTTFHQVNAASGIIIHDMEPKQLWDDILGLFNNCTVPIEEGKDEFGIVRNYVAYNNMVGSVPTESSQINGFNPLRNRQPIANKGVPTAALPLYEDTASIPTDAVLGETPIVIGAGYYLVEILSLNLAQSNLIDNKENRGNISAIVSTQYNANDSITGFADSGIPYIHRGAPVSIASANVRILDPDTKDVPTNLGNRNTVFLQVNGTAPVYNPTPVAPNKDSPTQQEVRGGR